jgi:hypothetical protein
MGVIDRIRGRVPEPSPDRITLDEILEDYNLEYVNDEPGEQYAVVTKKSKVATRRETVPLGNEYGTSSPSPWTSFTRNEYNPALQGFKGLEMYDKMRKSDGGVRSTLRAAKTPVLAARYFVQPGGKKDIDKKAAKWVEKNLFELMSTPWAQTLTEALLMLDFGYYAFEKVWINRVVDGELRTVLKKLGPRHPMDVKSWQFDVNGGPHSACFYPASATYPLEDIEIPIQKLLVFTFDKEAGNIEGISILRSAYKHWYYKEQLYKIDAIQKERHGIGIPVIKLPLGYGEDDKTAAQNLGRNIRTNERAHIVLPPGWDLYMLKLEGQPVDCLKSIDHHDTMIRMNILGEFLNTAGGTSKEEDQTMFLKATRFVADIFTDTINAYLIPEMVGYNFANAAIPKLRARRIGEQEDQRTTSFTVRNMVGSGIIVPDDVLEDAIRDALDLPERDEATARPQTGADLAILNDQLDAEEADDEARGSGSDSNGLPNGGNSSARGARVGLPRQAPAGRQRQGRPNRSQGKDVSGGQ